MGVLNLTRGLGGHDEYYGTWRGGRRIKLGVLNSRGPSLKLSVLDFALWRDVLLLLPPCSLDLDDGARSFE